MKRRVDGEGRNEQNGNNYFIKLLMKYDTLKPFEKDICSFLPDRIGGKRGSDPLPKERLVAELFKLYRTNCGWRGIWHSSTVRNYVCEMQKRGNFSKYFNSLI